MPTITTEPLMNIAKNSDLRIYERLQKILGDDKKISSDAEARAILSIPASDIIFTDNKEELSLAKMMAYSYLKGDCKNFWDDLASAYKFCKDKGSALWARISDYINSGYTYAQSK